MLTHITSDELRAAIASALVRLAPSGGDRALPHDVLCNGLIDLLADSLAAARPASAEELERLSQLFREKLEAAMARRGVAGHA